MVKLKSLLGKPQSPSFQILAEIIQVTGPDRVLRQHRSIRFPNGTCQVWGFSAQDPDAEVKPMVVAVFIRDRRLVAWKKLVISFDKAVKHYRLKANEALSDGASVPHDEYPQPQLPADITVIWPERGRAGR